MDSLKKMIAVGGGLALGLAATGVLAVIDKKKMLENRGKPRPSADRYHISPKNRRIWLWPS